MLGSIVTDFTGRPGGDQHQPEGGQIPPAAAGSEGTADAGGFQTVARLADIPPGEARSFVVQGELVGVFRDGENWFAIGDLCPHAGASLSGGYFADGAVMCPWHAWKFRLRDGCWLDAPQSPVRCQTFRIRVVGDEVQVGPRFEAARAESPE